MFKRKILKVLALVLVLNILIIPLTSFCPQEQNKYKVMAAEGVVDPQFYAAILTMIGITSVMIGSMSENFSIPAADFTALKDQFSQTLEADVTKKAAWMIAQTEYLAGGTSKTMGAVELAKIGINDLYDEFLSYIHTKYPILQIGTINLSATINPPDSNYLSYKYLKTVGDCELYTYNGSAYNAVSLIGGVDNLCNFRIWQYNSLYFSYYNKFLWENSLFGTTTYNGDIQYLYIYDLTLNSWDKARIIFNKDNSKFNILLDPYYGNTVVTQKDYDNYKKILSTFGISFNYNLAGLITSNPVVFGSVDYFDNSEIINSTESYRSLIPTIPWIDSTVPAGTIITPAISAPYAGTVPIDVPLTVPIDPPIDEPVDPPVEDNIAGTIAAILAGLTPIAGFLEYILAGQVSLTDTIEAGITGVIDGIGDIAGTLTGGITSTLTDIQTAINDMVNPSLENVEQLNLDPIKNIPAVLFSRFPFSIPFDFYNIIAYMGGSAREAPEFNFTVPLSSIGQEDVIKAIDMEPFDQIAGYIRIAELIAFAIAVMLKTKTLIWG